MLEERQYVEAGLRAAIDAYESRIAALEADRSRLIKSLMRCGKRLAFAKDRERELNGAESKLARIAALVKPVPVAELVEAGTEAPALLAERHRRIRAILEDEG